MSDLPPPTGSPMSFGPKPKRGPGCPDCPHGPDSDCPRSSDSVSDCSSTGLSDAEYEARSANRFLDPDHFMFQALSVLGPGVWRP